jgi:predicted TIM-barrel fold metal-dependent hydrolase
MKAVGNIELENLEEGIKELKRIRELGLVAGFISVDPGEDSNYGDPRYDLFWATAQDLDMPLSLHIGSDKNRSFGGPSRSATRNREGIENSLTALIFGGTLERFPKLKIISAENNLGWAPFFIHMLDRAVTRMRHTRVYDMTKIKILPSEYLQRQVHFSFLSHDVLWIPVRNTIGVDQIMWSSDYPHAEATMDGAALGSRRTVAEIFRDVPDPETRKMVGENAARVFGF